jgi:hypothetical protein
MIEIPAQQKAAASELEQAANGSKSANENDPSTTKSTDDLANTADAEGDEVCSL